MKYYYKVVQDPTLPPPEQRSNPHSPVMDNQDMEYWLTDMQDRGWEFVSCGQKQWIGSEEFVQNFWIFRKRRKI